MFKYYLDELWFQRVNDVWEKSRLETAVYFKMYVSIQDSYENISKVIIIIFSLLPYLVYPVMCFQSH
jgi:hypothetical protein